MCFLLLPVHDHNPPQTAVAAIPRAKEENKSLKTAFTLTLFLASSVTNFSKDGRPEDSQHNNRIRKREWGDSEHVAEMCNNGSWMMTKRTNTRGEKCRIASLAKTHTEDLRATFLTQVYIDLYICGESLCLGKGYFGCGSKKTLEHSTSDNFLSIAPSMFNENSTHTNLKSHTSQINIEWNGSRQKNHQKMCIDVHCMSQILTHNIWKSSGTGKPHVIHWT